MADYHLHGKVISRGQGRSAVGAAAYRSGEKLTNEKDGITHDYTKKGGVVYTEIILCENAPKEYQDRATLWNSVENIATARERLARDFDVALPIELNREEQVQLVRNYINDNFVKAGMCADFAIHDKADGNPHAHIMLTMRPIDENGKWEYVSQKVYICKDQQGNTAELSASELKKAQAEGKTYEKQLPYFKNGKGKATYLTKHEAENEPKYKDYIRVKGKNDPLKTKEDRRNPIIEKWDSTDSFNKWRENWAAYQNREFEKKNLSVRVDNRSYEAQGIDKIPTKHLGVSAKAMECKGTTSERGNENRGIKIANIQTETLKIQTQYIQKEMSYIREDINWNTIHEKIAAAERAIPRLGEKELQGLQVQLEKTKENMRNMKPTETSKGRTIEYDLRQIPYFDYHRNKVIGDCAFAQDKIKRQIETLEQKRQEQTRTETTPKPAEPTRPQPQGTPKPTEQQAAERQSVSFNAASMARQLAMLKNEYVRETIKETGSRAAEAKAKLLELAKTVPADQQQAVRSQMGQYADHSQKGMAHIKANIEMQKLLDEAFKGRAESREHEKVQTIERDR